MEGFAHVIIHEFIGAFIARLAQWTWAEGWVQTPQTTVLNVHVPPFTVLNGLTSVLNLICVESSESWFLCIALKSRLAFFSVNSTLSDVPHYDEADHQAAFSLPGSHVATQMLTVLKSRSGIQDPVENQQGWKETTSFYCCNPLRSDTRNCLWSWQRLKIMVIKSRSIQVKKNQKNSSGVVFSLLFSGW